MKIRLLIAALAVPVAVILAVPASANAALGLHLGGLFGHSSTPPNPTPPPTAPAPLIVGLDALVKVDVHVPLPGPTNKPPYYGPGKGLHLGFILGVGNPHH
jgi:hypothetical protein